MYYFFNNISDIGKKRDRSAVLKITAGQRSLTITTAFVTAEKLYRMVTMTANT